MPSTPSGVGGIDVHLRAKEDGKGLLIAPPDGVDQTQLRPGRGQSAARPTTPRQTRTRNRYGRVYVDIRAYMPDQASSAVSKCQRRAECSAASNMFNNNY